MIPPDLDDYGKLRYVYERRAAELRELLRAGGIIDSFGPGYCDRALAGLKEAREQHGLFDAADATAAEDLKAR